MNSASISLHSYYSSYAFLQFYMVQYGWIGFGWLNFGYFSVIQALVGVLRGANWVSRVSLIIISMNDIGCAQLTTNINFNLNMWIILNLEWRGWGCDNYFYEWYLMCTINH